MNSSFKRSGLFKRIWNEDRGVLTFEWILLITLLVIGIVGGVSAVRDGLIDELGDVSDAVVNIDQSYSVNAGPCSGPNGETLGTAFGFQDTVPNCESGDGSTRGRSDFEGQSGSMVPRPRR